MDIGIDIDTAADADSVQEKSVTFAEEVKDSKSLNIERDDDEVVVLQNSELELGEGLPADTTAELSVDQHTKYVDHCSLPKPSSQIRFRGTGKAHVYPNSRGQFILEEDGDEMIAKWVDTYNGKLKFLRCLYTFVAVFWTGFLVVLSIELILYLILDFTIAAGVTNKQEDPQAFQATGVLFALPLYVYGMSSSLVLAGQFVSDAWNGHLLMNQFVYGQLHSVLLEWIDFWVFLGVPLFTMVGCILASLQSWWEITILVWFTSISIAYITFCVVVMYYEFRANWEVTRNHLITNLGGHQDKSWWATTKRAILLRQRHVFGGVVKSTYFIKGKMEQKKGDHGKEGDRLNVRESQVEKREEISSGKTWYCHFISLKIFQRIGMFVPTEEPEPQFTMSDIQDMRGFVTSDTWSLEAIYCRPRNSRFVAVLAGPQAMTQPQIRSSVVCNALANFIYILIFVALLMWLGLQAWAVVVAVIVFIAFVLYPNILSAYQTAKMTQKQQKYVAEDDEEEGSESKKTTNDDNNLSASVGTFQVWESHRIITPTKTFCWVIFAMEVLFLFLWPLVSLITVGNAAISSIFVVICGFCWVRSYFNAAIVLEETGTMDLVDGEKGTAEHWQNISRLNTIVTKVTRSHAKSVWMTILVIIVIIMLAMGVMSVDTTPVSGEDVGGDTEFLTYLPDYEYTGNDGTIPYPSCSFGRDFRVGARGNYTRRDLADYTFLAALAYIDDNVTQSQLDQWFAFENKLNQRNVTNDQEGVQKFRQSIESQSPVVYKAIDIPIPQGNKTDVMVIIRGSKSAFDFLTDAQLWFAAVLFQCLRFILPFGNVWTPIMHHLIEAISWLESTSLSKISFYKETTGFIQWIQENNGDSIANVEVTGHSLGGGLAFISAAQAKVPGIGVSAPNAMLSRSAFDPTLEATALDELTFNIVPDYDVVPRCDDVAQNFQKTRCLANTGTFLGDAVACHGTGRRTLCELLIQCGTNNRPALCECHYEFGYPQPTPKYKNIGPPLEEQCAAVIERMKKNEN